MKEILVEEPIIIEMFHQRNEANTNKNDSYEMSKDRNINQSSK